MTTAQNEAERLSAISSHSGETATGEYSAELAAALEDICAGSSCSEHDISYVAWGDRDGRSWRVELL